MYAVLFILTAALLMTGCGKTYNQILKTAHDAVDIAGKIIDDVKDNGAAVKEAFKPDVPENHNK